MTDIAIKIRIARAFGAGIQAALTPAQFRELLDLDADDSGICHSHDFCDANMVMLAAFTETMGHEPAFLTEEHAETDLNLWNDAWEIAIAANFFA
jgi:hypothetical protein